MVAVVLLFWHQVARDRIESVGFVRCAGEMAFFEEGSKRSADVFADMMCTVGLVLYNDLQRLSEHYPILQVRTSLRRSVIVS